jgi:integrase
VTDAEYDAVYKLASERMRIAMDLALLTGQRRGDLLTLTRAKLTDEGIVFNQSKTGAGVLVEWTDELRKITDRAKALKPQVPGEYLLRKRSGRPYTAWGFSAIWQRLMDKATASGKNGEAPVLAERFTFHDLRASARATRTGWRAPRHSWVMQARSQPSPFIAARCRAQHRYGEKY